MEFFIFPESGYLSSHLFCEHFSDGQPQACGILPGFYSKETVEELACQYFVKIAGCIGKRDDPILIQGNGQISFAVF